MATGEPWTADELATLERLRGERQSMAYIAKQLRNRTRNAVIGAAHRLKLPRYTQRDRVQCWRAAKPKIVSGWSYSRTPARKPTTPTPMPKAKPASRFSDDQAGRVAEALLGSAYAAERRRQSWLTERSYARS